MDRATLPRLDTPRDRSRCRRVGFAPKEMYSAWDQHMGIAASVGPPRFNPWPGKLLPSQSCSLIIPPWLANFSIAALLCHFCRTDEQDAATQPVHSAAIACVGREVEFGVNDGSLPLTEVSFPVSLERLG
jgi:hypothetical protein